jgi:hypothetical protein
VALGVRHDHGSDTGSSHPIFTTYYMIPIAMLSLWTALFASLVRPAEAVDHGLAEQAAGAGS